jgi:hypothetical protein
MATATTIFRTKPDIQLGLTNEEAEFLAAVLALIGGSPEKTCRSIADNITEALESVGVNYKNDFDDQIRGTLTCMSEDEL